MTSFSSLDEACDAVRAFIRRCNDDPRTGGFNELALGLFAFQFAHNTPYASLCREEGRTRCPRNALAYNCVHAAKQVYCVLPVTGNKGVAKKQTQDKTL